MSNNPYSQYNPYNPSNIPPVPQASSSGTRPTSITVFGILNIVFGVLGLAGTCIGAVGLVAMQNSSMALNPNDPATPFASVNSSSNAMAYFIATAIVGLIFSGILIAAGAFLLKGKALGRHLSNIYGAYGVIFTIINIPIQFMLNSPDTSAERIGLAIGSIVGALVGLTYPILLLIFVNLRTAIAYLK